MPFQVLKAWNIVYTNKKTQNMLRCSFAHHLKWRYFQILTHGLLFTMPHENAVLFCIEWLCWKTAGKTAPRFIEIKWRGNSGIAWIEPSPPFSSKQNNFCDLFCSSFLYCFSRTLLVLQYNWSFKIKPAPKIYISTSLVNFEKLSIYGQKSHWNIMVAQLTLTTWSTYPTPHVNWATLPFKKKSFMCIHRTNWFNYYVIRT